MKISIKSKIKKVLILALLTSGVLMNVAFAGEVVTEPEGSTLLPSKGSLTESDCEALMIYVNTHMQPTTYEELMDPNEEGPTEQTTVAGIKEQIAKKSKEIEFQSYDAKTGNTTYYRVTYSHVLGCAITTGDVKAWMIPFFIRYILEFIIGLAGLVAVGGIVYGGYLYLFAGISDDKDKGKNAIKNGILGFVIVLTSWAIVNIVITLVTL